MARFQNGCENNIYSNQLAILIVENIPVEEEPKVYTIPEIPEDQIKKYKGYYHFFYVILRFKKDVGVDSK